MDKRILVAAIVVAAAVAIIVGYMFVGRGSTAAPNTSGTAAGTTTASAKAVAKKSLRDCGGNAVAVVYGGGQEKLAKAMAELLAQQLAADVPKGTTFCYVPISGSGLQKPRVLPLILVKTSHMSGRLKQLLLNETLAGGYKPVRYDVDAVFATQVAMRERLPGPRYAYTATLLVVQGHVNETRVDVKKLEADKNFMTLLEAVFAANITRVVPVDEPPRGVAVDSRPNLVVESSFNLSSGDPGVREAARGYYVASHIDFAVVLSERRLAEAFERIGVPPMIGLHPALGSGPVHIAIYEDFMCPFCAEFYATVFPKLMKLADEGKITLHFMDLIVHPQPVVKKLHQLLACYYAETHNATGYVKAVEEIYSLLRRDMAKLQKSQINETGLLNDYQKLYEKLSKQLGANTTCRAAVLPEESTKAAEKLGLRGTPSFAVWGNDLGYTVYTVGYHDYKFFANLIKELEAQLNAAHGG